MDAAGFIMDILFPAECLACGTRLRHGTFCDACRLGIAPHRAAFCGACGAALPGLRAVCHPGIPYLMGAAGDYANPALRTLIHALKFGRMRSAAEPLADILAHYCARLPIELRGFTVVPVPISRERMRERGFNQSVLIAERVAHFFGLPLAKKLLLRTAHRPPQSEIADHEERHRNIRECFTAQAGGKKILLIDDVTTSGATFTEASLTLRAAGARKIFAVAVAKAS